MTLATGKSLAHYSILAPLGAGAMGAVYRARDTRLGREVAIKVLPEAFAADAERLRRFEREATSLATLNHPNVAQIFGVDRDGDVCFLVLELVPGESLEERLKRGPLPVDEAIDVCRQIAEGLEAAHEAGVIHRDLKPANVLLTPDGKVKLLDFGLAKPARTSSDDVKSATDSVLTTESGRLLGTPTYMAPEQARGKSIDKRVDVWAFGCVLFECLTAKRAFDGESLTDVLAAVIEHEADFSKLPTTTPSRVRELMARCLAKDPRARLRDVGEARIALERAGSERGDRTEKPASRHRTTLLVTVGAAVAAAIAGALVHRVLAPSRSAELVKQQPITFSGFDEAPAASPDGRTLAFVSARDGKSRIWLKQLAGGGEAALTDGPDRAPRFAPDGSSILFVRSEGDRSSIYRTALVGGQPRKVIDNAVEADASPDGRSIAFLRESGSAGGRCGALHVANVDGSSERALCTSQTQPLFGVRWSPDGKRIAVTETRAFNNARCRVLVVDAERGAVTELRGGDPEGRPSAVAWSGRGDEVIYSSDPMSNYDVQISRVVAHDVRTGKVRGLFWTRDLKGSLDVIATGTLVFGAAARRQNLKAITLHGAAAPEVKALTLGNSLDRQPVVAPDGETVIFSSSRSGNLDLWTVSIATGNVSRLTDDAEPDWDPAITPDGRSAVWSSGRSGTLEIWMARLDGSGARQITRDGVDAENPTMTADGAWIVYSTSNAAHPGLHRIRPDGSDDRVLAAGSNFLPEVSPDGRRALFLEQRPEVGANLVRVVEIESGTIDPFEIRCRIPDREPLGGRLGRARWIPDGSAIAFVATDETGEFGIQVQDFRPGKDTSSSRRTLVKLEPGSVIESFGLSRDGTHVIASVQEVIASVMTADHVPGVEPPRR